MKIYFSRGPTIESRTTAKYSYSLRMVNTHYTGLLNRIYSKYYSRYQILVYISLNLSLISPSFGKTRRISRFLWEKKQGQINFIPTLRPKQGQIFCVPIFSKSILGAIQPIAMTNFQKTVRKGGFMGHFLSRRSPLCTGEIAYT